jgi:cytoskeletal protein CcmA (bactofilin family)
VHILIGDTARITGAITGQDVIVHGVVMGSIRSKRVVLAASCKVEGDVFHEALTIEQGAYFEGKSRRGGSAVGSAGANLDYPPYQSNT